MPDHPRTPLPPATAAAHCHVPPHPGDAPEPGAAPAAYDELGRLALMERADTPSVHGPAKCCRSTMADAHLTRLADPLSHAGDDRPAVLRVSLDEGARLPTRAFPTDAGLDLWPTGDTLPRLMPHETRRYNTGVRVEVPVGYVGIIATRSGMAGRSVEVGGGIIDAGFRGPMEVALTNHGQAQWVGEPGKAIAQLLVVPCLLLAPMVVDGLGATDRGAKGFGSSDRKGDAS